MEEIGERLNETETQTETTFGVDATRREQEALNKLAEQYGSVDDFVVDMLQYDSQEQLHKALSVLTGQTLCLF